MYMQLQKELALIPRCFEPAKQRNNTKTVASYSTLQHDIYKYITLINLQNCTVKRKIICTQTKRN